MSVTERSDGCVTRRCSLPSASSQNPLTNTAFWMIYQHMIKNAHITSSYFWLYL